MLRVRFGAVALFLVVASCSSGPGGEATTTAAAETTSTVPDTTTTLPDTTTTTNLQVTTTARVATTIPVATTVAETDGSEGSGCTPGSSTTLPDGTWFGLVTATTADTVVFDLACWFVGDAAVEAAAEDGEESPPPNDYYVRNQNPTTRVVPVSASATAVYYPTGDPTGETEGTFDDWRSMVEERGPFFGVWLEVVNGEATVIREQWVP